MGIFDNPLGRAVVDLVVDASVKAGSTIARLVRGQVGEQAVPIPDVIVAVRNGDSRGWYEAAANAQELADGHDLATGESSRLVGEVARSWRGDAAVLATQRIQAMSTVAASAAVSYAENARNLTDVAGAFDRVKHSVEDMPDRPPNKSLWDIITPWRTDTEVAISEYNAAARKNLALYNDYARTAEDATRRLRHHYGDVEPLDQGAPPEGTYRGGPGAIGHTSPAAYGGVGTPAWPQQSPAAPPAQGITTPSAVAPVYSATTPSATPIHPAQPLAAAVTPLRAGGAEPGAGGLSPQPGRVPLGAGQRQPGAGGRVGAGPASPLSNSGVRPAGGVGPQPGARPGAPGLPMGAGAPARGEDDAEHRDKYGQGDPSLFGPAGDKAVDPVTGMRVIPPGAIGG